MTAPSGEQSVAAAGLTTIDGVRGPAGHLIDITMRDGVVTGVRAGSTGSRTVLPGLVEPHAHLDKALSAGATALARGGPLTRADGLLAAVDAWNLLVADMPAADIAERAARALDEYLGHGVSVVRTHSHVGGPAGLRCVEGTLAARARFTGLLEVQIAAMCQPPLTGAAGTDNRALLMAALDAGAEVVAGYPWLDDDPVGSTRFLVETAAERGLPLDLHLDETLDPDSRTLEILARAVLDIQPGIPVAASHCCSLAVQPQDRLLEICDLVAAAGIAVITLPQTNLWLQGNGAGASPRGLTAVRELQAAGVVVAAGGDNVRDVFNPLGRADPLEAAALVQVCAQLETDAAIAMVTSDARRALGLPPAGPTLGAVADLVVFDAPDVATVLAAATPTREVWHRGTLVARTTLTHTRPKTPPNHRQLVRSDGFSTHDAVLRYP